jgi:hypothetical protein
MKGHTLILILCALFLPAAFAQEDRKSAGIAHSGIPPAPLANVRVTAGARHAVFKFEGSPNAAPRVMVVNGPLRKMPDGSLMFDGPPLHLKAVRNSLVNAAGRVEFIAASNVHRDPQASDQWLTIVPGAQYHYFIFEKSSAQTLEGSFTTPDLDDPADEALQPELPDPPLPGH